MRLANTVALLLFLFATSAYADEAVWARLKQGGNVVLVRHAVTTPGVGDPPGMQLDGCATQRNLTDEGRAHARRIGEEWRRRAIPMERIVSSPWCRCLETARLAFGKPEVSEALSNLFGRQENREKQVRALRALVPKGTGNLVLVTHGSTIQALTGVSPGTGEMVVVANGEVAGRLAVP